MDRNVVARALALLFVLIATMLPGTAAEAADAIDGLTSLSAGGEHTCARTTTGAVKCWGLNDVGQLGDGTQTTRLTPPSGAGIPGFSVVATRSQHTCGIAAFDGGVWCWGSNARAQTGTGGSNNFRKSPVKITSGGFDSGVTHISLGGEFSCGIKGGGVKCWGRGDDGQIGNNQTVTAFQPLQVTGLSPGSGVKAIAAGGKHVCVITSTDTVKCWGLNADGQLGNNSVVSSKVPIDVPGLTNVTALALGGLHSCALTASGAMSCWGDNSAGQLGDGSNTDRYTPVTVSGFGSGVKSMAANNRETCAIKTDSSLWCWGLNTSGQVGDSTTTDRKAPTAVPGGSSNVDSVTVGRAHACLRLTTGPSRCWGENANGQLGDGTKTDNYGPFVPDPPRSIVATRGDQTASVTWAAPISNGGFSLTGYTVTLSPGGQTTNVVPGNPLTASFSGLTNGTAYTFSVRATNQSGAYRVAKSNTVVPAGLPGPPGLPLTASATSSTATIGWQSAPTNGSAISQYSVVAEPGGRSATVSGSSRKATITGLTSGKSYKFTVKARNGVGWSSAVSITKLLPKAKSGYLMVSANGAVYPFGDSPRLGSAVYANWAGGVRAAAIAVRANGSGYWVVDSAGGVRAFGTAKFLGQRPPLKPGEVVSTLAPTPTGNGYWLFTNRGRATAYGDAKFLGDMRNTRLNGPVIASTATPTGKGYFMVASDGGVFAFGDAKFRGSMGAKRLNKPVVGLSATPTNKGYWLVAADGGVFAFGDAGFKGSMGGTRLAKPVNGLVPFGNGYLMVASDGGVFVFSNKPFFGSLGARPPSAPVIGIAAFSF
jgi:alpha-tubulin suppressor-like RCC1 family protein/ribosomal protein L24E